MESATIRARNQRSRRERKQQPAFSFRVREKKKAEKGEGEYFTSTTTCRRSSGLGKPRDPFASRTNQGFDTQDARAVAGGGPRVFAVGESPSSRTLASPTRSLTSSPEQTPNLHLGGPFLTVAISTVEVPLIGVQPNTINEFNYFRSEITYVLLTLEAVQFGSV